MHLPTHLPCSTIASRKYTLSRGSCVGICTGFVTLYEHGSFSDWSAAFSKGDYSVAQFVANGASNDEVSSLRVPTGCEAILYGGDDFNGWSAVFSAGEYNITAFTANGAVNDAVSSLIVDDAGHCIPCRTTSIVLSLV